MRRSLEAGARAGAGAGHQASEPVDMAAKESVIPGLCCARFAPTVVAMDEQVKCCTNISSCMTSTCKEFCRAAVARAVATCRSPKSVLYSPHVVCTRKRQTRTGEV